MKDTPEFKAAHKKALDARDAYNLGAINFKEAEERMQDYRILFNEYAKERAGQYGVKPQKFSPKMFMKYGK